jgi:hypothetical protein
MRRIFVPLLLLIGLLLYWWPFAKQQQPPTKKQTPESLSASSPTPKAPPRRQITLQEIMELSGDGYTQDPTGALTLQGQVLNEAGAPVADAQVGISSLPARQAITDKEGRFLFDNLLERDYYLIASKDDLYGDAIAPVTKDEIPVTIRVYTGKSVEVTVLDAIDRKPISNAQISWGMFLPREEITNPEGKATLRGLGPWEFFQVFADGYGPQGFMAQTNAAGGVGTQTVLLSPGAAVSGVVLAPDGKPVSQARIFVESDAGVMFRDDAHPIISDAEGKWSIPALGAGPHLFIGRHPRFAEGTSEQILLDGKTPKTDVVIRLEPSGVLTGQVQDRKGQGVAGAEVIVEDNIGASRSARRNTFTKSDGSFSVEGLHLSQLLVGAASDGRSASPGKVDLTSGSASVTLVLDIDGEITGTVVDQNGEPIADASVRAMPLEFLSDRTRWQMMIPRQARTDPDGRFIMTSVAEGAEYRLDAEFPKMRQKSDEGDLIKAKAGDKNVKIVLQELGGITGKLQFEDGSTPKTFNVGAYTEGLSSFSETNGSFTVNEVTACKQVVFFSGPEFQDKRSPRIEVKPGEVFDLGTITVSRGKTVRGVVLSDGKPVEGATVAASTFIGGSGSRLDPDDELNARDRTLSKADGSFEIKGLTEMDELSVLAEHPTLGRSAVQSVPKGRGDVTLELTLSKGGKVEGIITYAGKPVEATAVAFLTTGEGNFVTNSGPNGKYQFTQLAPGDYELGAYYATESQSSGKQPSRKVVALHVEEGKTQKINIDIPAGIDVTVNPTKDGITADHVTIRLIAQTITAKDTEELWAKLEALPKSQVFTGYLVVRIPGSAPTPVVFKDVPAGLYTLCVGQNPSNEEKATMSDEERRAPRPIVCQPQEIKTEPKEQRIDIALPSSSRD